LLERACGRRLYRIGRSGTRGANIDPIPASTLRWVRIEVLTKGKNENRDLLHSVLRGIQE
jgi:hypothetical protein